MQQEFSKCQVASKELKDLERLQRYLERKHCESQIRYVPVLQNWVLYLTYIPQNLLAPSNSASAIAKMRYKAYGRYGKLKCRICGEVTESLPEMATHYREKHRGNEDGG